jgi:hypothetical protein
LEPGFWLTLTYEDVAGKGWITQARYIATDRRYTDVTVRNAAGARSEN